jgi:mannose-6-phosphate isomerase-like protein (cupin superfamily)
MCLAHREREEGRVTPGRETGVPLPGGTSVSHVKVYDTVGPDGLAGGSPHLHTACTEAYLVIAGHGAVQTLSGDGYAETPLEAGTVAWFSPGTVHRLVNHDGALELYVVMSNAGLPEAGDMVLAFEPHLLADDATYRDLADLPAHARTTIGTPDPVMRRRDHAVTGFAHWRREVETHGPEALRPLHLAAAALLGDRPATWTELLDADPATDLDRSRTQVDALHRGEHDMVADALQESAIRSRSLHPDVRRMGCCGTLGTVVH